MKQTIIAQLNAWPSFMTKAVLHASATAFLVAFLLTLPAAARAQDPVIVIDPMDDSCQPATAAFASCAAACEADAENCAEVIRSHINLSEVQDRLQLYPTTKENDPNPTTPMHGLFNTMKVNQPAFDSITAGIVDPTAAIELPAWSIVAKYNESPTDDKGTLEVWETHMYKIPGYCPDRADASPDAPCVGGEWFWFLDRNGLRVFNGEAAYGKAETFCLECHSAVSEADWLWVTHFRRDRALQLANPLRFDGETPVSGGVGFCNSVTALNPNQPADVGRNPASISPASNAQKMFDCFAWRAFIAMNWPALRKQRGKPAKGLLFNAANRNRVWETFKQIYETFQPQDENWTLRGKTWNEVQPLPQVCIDALEAAPDQFPQNTRAYPVLNERNQAYGNQFDTLVDVNGNNLHYNIRFNRPEWSFLKQNGYADTGSYDYQGPTGQKIVFPDNLGSLGRFGAIEVKSAWKELCTDPESCVMVDDPSRYYSRAAFIYMPPGTSPSGPVAESCRIAQVGLVGLHSMLKTFWAPQWIWSTFEQIDNVPEVDEVVAPDDPPFTLFNPQCLINPPTPQQCLFQRPGSFATSGQLSCCENLQVIANANPEQDGNAPYGTIDVDGINPQIPAQITRIDQVDDIAEGLNGIFQGLLQEADSPFQYYRLINTQWAGKGRLGADAETPYAVVNQLCLEGDSDPCFTLLPEGLRLRNTTMETFQVSYCAPDDEDIFNNPADCIPSTIADSPAHASSAGCMNCHLPSGNDTSFIWEDAIWERVGIATANGEEAAARAGP